MMTMKKKHLIAAGILACTSLPTFAQESTDAPKGKAIVQVFTNFHTGFGKTNDQRGFDLDRSYLGYEYALTPGLKVKAVMDIGKSSDVGDYQRIAYIKNAQLSWKTGNLTLNGGLISCNQFGTQEKFWGYRYIMKSFQDQYKFGHSADLGISASYQFAKWISADAIITNGEGYKKVQVDDGLQYGLGATIKPIKGLTLRIYGGFNEASDPEGKDTWNIAGFAGYQHQYFSVGAEYNYMQNSSFKKDADLNGLSFYATGNCTDKIQVFARYDRLDSKDDWNKAKDEQAVIAGAQFKLGKYVKLAPNFRMSIPEADNADNKYSAYVSCYFGI